ncbi:MAG: hypothetical protein Q8N63_08295 [Nanoarchaeota archaeon]|nr:hypothetical protein [Nanoarchaeota archaeon]
MGKETQHDYNEDLDILHVYNSDISSGLKGCLTYGNFNIDISEDNKVVGVELEGASSVLNMPKDKLASLDNAMLMVRKIGNILFIGFTVIKGEQKSTIQINVQSQNKIAVLN